MQQGSAWCTVLLALSGVAGCNALVGFEDLPYKGEGGVRDASVDARSRSDATRPRESGDATTPDVRPDHPETDAHSDSVQHADASHDAGPKCSPATAWPTMFGSPITPPFQLAGLDLRGTDDAGITESEVVAAACSVTDAGDVPPGMHSVSWGDAGEAVLTYDTASGRYDELTLSAGYTGALDFYGPDGGAHYHAAIGQPITKDGARYELDWYGTPDGGRSIEAELTELYNAMIATYAAGTPASADCVQSGHCVENNDVIGVWVFGPSYPFEFYMSFDDALYNPNVPSLFIAPTPFQVFNDFSNQSEWSSFDTTLVAPNLVSFSGVEYDGNLGLYLLPSGATTPVAKYDIGDDDFTSKDSWQDFYVTQLTPEPQGFSGGAWDPADKLLYLAGTTGVAVLYNASSAFTVPAAWSSFDTKTLTPAPTGFAGATVVSFIDIDAVFAPSQGGVAAMFCYSCANWSSSGFTQASNWKTFDLTTIDSRLSKFHGALWVEVGAGSPFVYLIPADDTLLVRWDQTKPFASASSWETFDLELVTGDNLSNAYSTGVYDGRYLYLSPATQSVPSSVVRYDTTLPFAAATSWEVGKVTLDEVTSTAWDGRYVYFSGLTSTIARYDSTMDFANDVSAWSHVDVSKFNANAIAFAGTATDGRYLYFVPDAYSTVMRFDAKFPPAGPALGPQFAAWSTY
jgi:hypothetical protein